MLPKIDGIRNNLLIAEKQGKTGELLAVREVEDGKNIVVVYKELSKEDGFVITAFLTSRKKQFERRRRI